MRKIRGLQTLDWYELQIAALVGTRREIEAIRQGWKGSHGCDNSESLWWKNVEGAAGELAFAKAMNRFYSGSVNTFKVGGDVGAIQIRTRSRDDYELIVRKDDRDEDIFVLVTGHSPVFHVRGWIRGGEAKTDQWIETHGSREPAYFVPQDKLHPLEALPE